MDNLTTIEIGAGLVVFWFVTLFVLWKLIDRKDRPGPITSNFAKECLILVHMGVLVVGIAMLVSGLQLFG